jgi:ankyrin repeat protein
MIDRRFPVRPNLIQLRHQAKDLLRAFRQGDAAATAEFRQHHPEHIPEDARLAHAQFVLARGYGLPNWPRLVIACQMTDAIWRGDVEAVRKLVLRNPHLLHEDTRGLKRSSWGPPLSYAANLGREEIIKMLRSLGADDLQPAFVRACLQGRINSARLLHTMGARPLLGTVMGPCETLCSSGLAYLLELGAELSDEHGDTLAPVATLLQTSNRSPQGKHGCFELMAGRGIILPDTPPMALHRGRVDLLEAHLKRNPHLLARTFSHYEIFPRELGCHADQSLALHGTPLAGTTLLHMCVDYDEIEIARWLIEQGADVNAKAEIDSEGFGGHTPLFSAVVSQAYLCGLQQDGALARLLLDHGADPNARASLRKRLRFVKDDSIHEFRDVTPLAWGLRFHYQAWVSQPAMRLIEERSGHL